MTRADGVALAAGVLVGSVLVWRALTSPPTALESWVWTHAEGRG